MSSPSAGRSRARPDLEQQKKLAKELLRRVSRRRQRGTSRAFAPSCPTRSASRSPTRSSCSRASTASRAGATLKHAHRVSAADERRAAARAHSRTRVSDRDANALRRLLERHAELRAQHQRADLRLRLARARRSCATMSRWSTCCSSSAPIPIGAATGGRADSTRCTARRGDAAERLIAAGAIPDACAAAHLDRLDLLADMIAADPSRVHERGGDGQTPLHFARSRAVVDLLLAAGADIDARDVDHRSTRGGVDAGRRRATGEIADRDRASISSSAAHRPTSFSRRRSA